MKLKNILLKTFPFMLIVILLYINAILELPTIIKVLITTLSGLFTGIYSVKLIDEILDTAKKSQEKNIEEINKKYK